MKSFWSNGGKVWASKIWILLNQNRFHFFRIYEGTDFWSPHLEAHVATNLGWDETGSKIIQPDEVEYKKEKYGILNLAQLDRSNDPDFGSGLHPKVWSLLNPCGRFDWHLLHNHPNNHYHTRHYCDYHPHHHHYCNHHPHPHQPHPWSIILVALQPHENNCATLASWIAHFWPGEEAFKVEIWLLCKFLFIHASFQWANNSPFAHCWLCWPIKCLITDLTKCEILDDQANLICCDISIIYSNFKYGSRYLMSKDRVVIEGLCWWVQAEVDARFKEFLTVLCT